MVMEKKTAPWQIQLRDVITDPLELCHVLDLNPSLLQNMCKASELFRLKVPRNFVARMQKSNIDDPLLKQVLPVREETLAMPGYTKDPLSEEKFNPVPGLLHKYYDRVLWLLAGTCAVNCRYCFRRVFPYNENVLGKKSWVPILNYINSNIQIQEVIYSGGDPLVLKDSVLSLLIDKIAAIPHIKRLRIHTRLPIVLPDRINEDLIHWMTKTRLDIILVVHCNHPNEIDEQVIEMMQRLRKANITLLNQAVLLKGINDSAETLIKLSEKLFKAAILPYYLHLLDPVQGAAHFEISIEQAKTLMQTVANSLSGYLVPKLVYEKPGALAKCAV